MQDAGASALWGLWELVSRNQAMHCWGKVLGWIPSSPVPPQNQHPALRGSVGMGWCVCRPLSPSASFCEQVAPQIHSIWSSTAR